MVPIDKLSIIVTIAFSYIVLKEKLSAKSWLGLILNNSRYFVAFGIVLGLNGQKIKPYNADIILQKGFVRAYEILYRYRGYICS